MASLTLRYLTHIPATYRFPDSCAGRGKNASTWNLECASALRVLKCTRIQPSILFKPSNTASQSSKSFVARAEFPTAEKGEETDEAKKLADEYSTTMQEAMGDNALIYRHELGMNYAFVLPDLIVGSCLQKAEDADRLKAEADVKTVLCLQQDSDLAYFGLELSPVVERIREIDGMTHVRQEIRDFDPHSLRINLPEAVAKLHKQMRQKGTPAYVHCTAGLGRAPAVALAYMFWMRGFQLAEANEVLQKVRRCSPKLLAIRAATCDILTGFATEKVVISWKNRGNPKRVEIAGLDIGWHNKLDLELQLHEGRWTITRDLPVGTYFFKFIVDGIWTMSMDGQISSPDASGSVNNIIEVIGKSSNSGAWTMRKRLMEEDALLSEEDRSVVVDKINAMADALDL